MEQIVRWCCGFGGKSTQCLNHNQCMMKIYFILYDKNQALNVTMICRHTIVEWMRQLRNVNQNCKLKTECRIQNGCQNESIDIVYIGAIIGITAPVKHCRSRCICNLGILKFIQKLKFNIVYSNISRRKFGISTNSRTIITIILFHVSRHWKI